MVNPCEMDDIFGTTQIPHPTNKTLREHVTKTLCKMSCNFGSAFWLSAEILGISPLTVVVLGKGGKWDSTLRKVPPTISSNMSFSHLLTQNKPGTDRVWFHSQKRSTNNWWRDRASWINGKKGLGLWFTPEGGGGQGGGGVYSEKQEVGEQFNPGLIFSLHHHGVVQTGWKHNDTVWDLNLFCFHSGRRKWLNMTSKKTSPTEKQPGIEPSTTPKSQS